MPLSERRRVLAAMAGHKHICAVCHDTFNDGFVAFERFPGGRTTQLCSNACLLWFNSLNREGQKRLADSWFGLRKRYTDKKGKVTW